MKLNRSQKRELAFLLIYQSMLNDDSLEEIFEANVAEFELITDKSVDETVNMVKEAQKYAVKADEVINKYSKTRKVERIAKIPVAVMRLAIYEMDCVREEEVPDKVAINEAIELCKKYAGEKDSKFVSGVLGSYYREKNDSHPASAEAPLLGERDNHPASAEAPLQGGDRES